MFRSLIIMLYKNVRLIIKKIVAIYIHSYLLIISEYLRENEIGGNQDE